MSKLVLKTNGQDRTSVKGHYQEKRGSPLITDKHRKQGIKETLLTLFFRSLIKL